MNNKLAKGLTFASILAATVFTGVTIYDQNGFLGSKKAEDTNYVAQVKQNKDDATADLKKEVAPVGQVHQASEVVAGAAPSTVNLPSPPPPPAEASVVYDAASAPAPLLQMEAKSAVSEKAKVANVADRAVASQVAAPIPASFEPMPYQIQPQVSGDKFQAFESNKFIKAGENSVSTFSIDVDTTAYSYVRRLLNQGSLPQKDSVRLEEMVNYFSYDYQLPESKSEPFKANVAVYPTPWNKNTKLMHIGVKGYEVDKAVKPRSNLVFLIDTSGSMSSQDKLPLLKQSLSMLIDTLQPEDTIGIVTYAGSAGVALEPTKVSDKQKILASLNNLQSGGSTAGEAGIVTAYNLAEKNFNSDSVNRILLATDGDFNVGLQDSESLKKLIEQKRDAGIYLSVLGFGTGNYNDAIMQSLAQNGNGNAAYIDSLTEARKVLVDEASTTLFPIANDVKIQVEFNPAKVKEYKLLGYETRALNREDFNNDKVDAGDIGSGSSVTAIYEIVTTDSNYQTVDPLRYSAEVKKEIVKPIENFSQEYAFLKVRYKLPKEKESKLITQPISASQEVSVANLNPEMKFASSVAAFSLLLRNDISKSDISYSDVAKLAEEGKGADKFGSRQEFINLVKNAEYIKPGAQPIPVEGIQPIPMPLPVYNK